MDKKGPVNSYHQLKIVPKTQYNFQKDFRRKKTEDRRRSTGQRSEVSLSVDAWQNAIWHNALILIPSDAVLGSAVNVVAALTVNEQDGEVDEVEVWNDVIDTCNMR